MRILTLGSGVKVIVSEFNKVEGNRYFDSESQTSFEIDHITQVSGDDPNMTATGLELTTHALQTASNAQSAPLESQNADLM